MFYWHSRKSMIAACLQLKMLFSNHNSYILLFFVKISSAFYVCCIYSGALQTIFYHRIK